MMMTNPEADGDTVTCSTLYYIKPVGLGTPAVESLSSYLLRLAQTHLLLVFALIELLVVGGTYEQM